MRKPTTTDFRVTRDYLEWAHESAADDAQPRALALLALPVQAPKSAHPYCLVSDPQLVAEIADVAELFVGGDDNNLRAASVRARAVTWLKDRGLTVRQALAGGVVQ